ncbi:MAG: hypothetical protein K2P81_17690 [Bacteriovoracaceae bacterium]|nr:hypothetical protein [Bacteriovoracaceae bacterium]
MMQRLGLKFWLTLASFSLITFTLMKGPSAFRKTAHDLTFTDEVSTTAAHAEVIMPDSGLSVSIEKRVDLFLSDLRSQPTEPEKWANLNAEWLKYAHQWFARVYPGEEKFNAYASLWVGKREKSKLWRLNCRNEFFPDMDDNELISKSQWLQGEEEWQEMQAKINRGLQTVDEEYDQALSALLGTRIKDFVKLHKLFVREFLPKKSGTKSYFL